MGTKNISKRQAFRRNITVLSCVAVPGILFPVIRSHFARPVLSRNQIREELPEKYRSTYDVWLTAYDKAGTANINDPAALNRILKELGTLQDDKWKLQGKRLKGRNFACVDLMADDVTTKISAFGASVNSNMYNLPFVVSSDLGLKGAIEEAGRVCYENPQNAIDLRVWNKKRGEVLAIYPWPGVRAAQKAFSLPVQAQPQAGTTLTLNP